MPSGSAPVLVVYCRPEQLLFSLYLVFTYYTLQLYTKYDDEGGRDSLEGGALPGP